MAKNKGVRLPSSGAGIANYSGDYKSKVSVKPGFVILMAIIILIIEIMLHTLS